MPIVYELLDRRTCTGWKREYLDYGWICKYRVSRAACIDFDLPNETDYALIALNESDKLVGLLKFDLDGHDLYSVGTWVRQKERKLGVAKALWSEAFVLLHVETAHVTVVSDRGLTLVDSLRLLFPEVKWIVKEEGDRKLRNLNVRSKRTTGENVSGRV